MKSQLICKRGTLSPEPPGIFRIPAYRKDDQKRTTSGRSSSFRLSTWLGARVASPQSPILRPSIYSLDVINNLVKPPKSGYVKTQPILTFRVVQKSGPGH